MSWLSVGFIITWDTEVGWAARKSDEQKLILVMVTPELK